MLPLLYPIVRSQEINILNKNKYQLDRRGRQGQARNSDLELWSGLPTAISLSLRLI